MASAEQLLRLIDELRSLSTGEVAIVKAAVAATRFALNAPKSEPDQERFDWLLTAPYRLTKREVEVAAALFNGASAPKAAKKLGISPRTLEVHRAHVFRKLDARNVADMVRKLAEGT